MLKRILSYHAECCHFARKQQKRNLRFKSKVLDHIALAEAGTREEFDDLEFLVNRGLCELNGVKNVVTLARRLA